MNVTIHYEPRVEWQAKRIGYFVDGLRALGFTTATTTARSRVTDDPAVLFGTTFFKDIEATPGDWLLVDRCSFGDTTRYVSLVWNGHGRRGDHRVPDDCQARPSRLGALPYPFELVDPWNPGRTHRDIVVACGQESAYSPDWELADFYDRAYHVYHATHWRPHPAVNDNPLGLPVYQDFDIERAITLNSSVALEYLKRGVPTLVVDPGGMAYGWEKYDTLRDFFEWLAWTQWSWDEIRTGTPIAHLFPPGNPSTAD